jgi:hypothetical protein
MSVRAHERDTTAVDATAAAHAREAIEAARVANAQFVFSPTIAPADIDVPVTMNTYKKTGSDFGRMLGTAPGLVDWVLKKYMDPKGVRSVVLLDGQHYLAYPNIKTNISKGEGPIVKPDGRDGLIDKLRFVNRAGSLPIVVWTEWCWKNVLGEKWADPEKTRLKTLGKERVEAFAREIGGQIAKTTGLPMVFVIVHYDHDAIARDSGNCRFPALTAQQVRDITGAGDYDHLMCEIDDVFITELYGEFSQRGYAVMPVSGDKGLIKSSATMARFAQYLGLSTPDFRRSLRLTLHKVPIAPLVPD